MNTYRVHAIEGAALSTKSGIQKLLSVHESNIEKTRIYVLTSVSSAELSLVSMTEKAENRDERLWSMLEHCRSNWIELGESALGGTDGDVIDAINTGFSEVEDLLRAIWLLGSASESACRFLLAKTSCFLAIILRAFFCDHGIDAEAFPVEEAIRAKEFASSAVFVYGNLILPSVMQRDASGRVRHEGESEYTASIIANNLSAPLTFWNMRSLLYTASIKDVPSAAVIDEMSYQEATELSFFGAPIVHPHAFLPVLEKKLPINLRYWGDIDNPGTLVSAGIKKGAKASVKAFSTVRNVSLITIEGGGMSGVPGVSSRLFSALRNENISVIFISQASSEYSISIAVPKDSSNLAGRIIRKEFSVELGNKAIDRIDVLPECAILAAVGDEMAGSIGVAGKFFSSLARAGVNIMAIAQGSGERNISAVIKQQDSTKALRALHSVFFLSEQTLSIGLIGPGNIGGTLLDQIAREKERLKRDFDLDIRIRGIATSRKMLLSEDGVDLSCWREEFEKGAVAYNDQVFFNHISATYYPHKAIVDCTSSQECADRYLSLLESGFHVITPNKKASSARYDSYKAVMDASHRTGNKFLYETTVGAGLPIITTIKDLRETGDNVLKVEGMVSGTLAWLFSNFDGSVPFSSLVLKAKEMGYTEPDPRDDLSGMDVARKTVILAREIGYKVEVEDINIRSLVPENLRTLSKDEFLERLPEMDAGMDELLRKAKAEGKSLRYVGKVDGGVCSVDLEFCDPDHPFSQASGTDNVIAFTTKRYFRQPLVIKGPGAGPEVTAAGVFADILRLGQYLGSRI